MVVTCASRIHWFRGCYGFTGFVGFMVSWFQCFRGCHCFTGFVGFMVSLVSWFLYSFVRFMVSLVSWENIRIGCVAPLALIVILGSWY